MTRAHGHFRRRLPRIDAHPVTDYDAWRRRSELYDAAFLLLGGWRAARSFLFNDHAGLAQAPIAKAMESQLGLIEATRVLRREALG